MRALPALRMRLSCLSVGLVALAITGVAAGCGTEAQPEPVVGDSTPAPAASPSDSPLPLNVVTDAQMRRFAANSPSRNLLLWWQAIQYQDVAAVIDVTTPRVVRVFGRDRLRRLTFKVGSALGGLQIIKTRIDGNRALARVAIVGYDRGEVDRAATIPSTFSLARVQDRWKVDELRYLNSLARSFDVE